MLEILLGFLLSMTPWGEITVDEKEEVVCYQETYETTSSITCVKLDND